MPPAHASGFPSPNDRGGQAPALRVSRPPPFHRRARALGCHTRMRAGSPRHAPIAGDRPPRYDEGSNYPLHHRSDLQKILTKNTKFAKIKSLSTIFGNVSREFDNFLHFSAKKILTKKLKFAKIRPVLTFLAIFLQKKFDISHVFVYN